MQGVPATKLDCTGIAKHAASTVAAKHTGKNRCIANVHTNALRQCFHTGSHDAMNQAHFLCCVPVSVFEGVTHHVVIPEHAVICSI